MTRPNPLAANVLSLPPSAEVKSSLLEFESATAALLATPVKPAARSMLWIVVSLVVACATAAALIPIDMVVTAAGRVVALQPTVVVQPLETAIVRAIHVREGQVVRAGEALARLDATFSAADADALEAQVRSFQAEVDRLSAEAANSPYRPTTSDSALSGPQVQRLAEPDRSSTRDSSSCSRRLTTASSAVSSSMRRWVRVT